MKNIFSKLAIALLVLAVFAFLFAIFVIFFDQAVLVRKGTFYRAALPEKVVALTFDDGPSAEWTPKILDALKKSGTKATFFMLGKHVEEYPDVARRVSQEGHDIGIHSYNHNNFIYYNKDQVKEDIQHTERIIKNATGKTTKLFRPPKGWLSKREKKKIREFGYEVVLWSLNSKDWVTFDDKYMVKYILKHVRPGDIILFHDSGGALSTEGGDRHETVLTIPRLIEKLKEKGYRFVTVSELLAMEKVNEEKI